MYYIQSMKQLQLNWIFRCLYVKQVSLSYYDLTFFNDSSIFRHILFILYLEEKLLCVLIIDNCSKKWFILFSTWLHAAVYALLPQKFSTNNHTTKKGNKEEVEPNLLALLSVKRELFFFTLFHCKCASVTLNRDESVFDSKGVGITTIFFNTQLF